MNAGFRGTFVIAWADSEIDGLTDAPAEALGVGASWSWTGRAVRVDGPQDVLVLDGAMGAQELRERAGRNAQRLVGPAITGPNRGDGRLDPHGPMRDGFAVTDGRQLYPVAVLTDPATGRTLLAFPAGVPAPGVEHWVTSISGLGRPPRVEPQPPVCFVEGTLIRTPDGDRPIETLSPGDRIVTRDDGAQPLLWVGHRHLTGARLHVSPELRPIRLAAPWAADGAPPLLLSPQHRVLVRGPAAQSLFGVSEVLVTAADLVDDRKVTVAHALRGVHYRHLLLPRHQVIWANGAPVETFNPAEAPLSRLDPDQRAALDTAIPGLATDPGRYGPPARRLLDRAEAAILRHGLRPGLHRAAAGSLQVAL